MSDQIRSGEGEMSFRLVRALRVAEVAMLGLLGLSIGNAQATVITSGCANTNVSCTLDELVNGGSIVIDDKLFDSWFVTDSSSLSIDIGGIDVLALDDQPLNPGVQFNANGNLSTVGSTLIDLVLAFSVATLDGSARIKDNSLEIREFSFGNNVGGFISIFEDIFDPSGTLLGEKSVTADNFPPPILDLFDSAEFAPQSLVSVVKLISLSGDGPDDIVSLDAFVQRFSQVPVPVPATFVLVALGAVGIGYQQHKQIKAA
jgi:hypothetical protein